MGSGLALARHRQRFARDPEARKRWEEREAEERQKKRQWEKFQAKLRPADETTEICDNVVYVTHVSLAGWLFPGPWANGRMQSARYCQGATLGLCMKNHLHATVSSGEEKADFQWEMSEKVIHAPTQQVDLVAAIVMEASSTDENILQRYVSGCRVTNTKAIVEWCRAPFCGRRHAVLVDSHVMSQRFRDSREESAVLRIPWALPSNVPGRPVRFRKYNLSDEESNLLLERLSQYEGPKLVMCNSSESWPERWDEPWDESWDRFPWEKESRESIGPTILIGSEMVKNIQHCEGIQKQTGGEYTIGQRSLPKKVFDVDTNAAVHYTAGMEYAALSYVWAQHSEKTTISTLQKLRVELGIRYWWVDRLCMMTAEEKAEEIPLMAGYYSNAAITVIYDREMAAKAMGDLKEAWTSKALSEFSENLHSQLMATTWAKRVWTLQEFLLARRILIATKDGLIDGYMLGSWAKAIGQTQDSLSFKRAPWYAIDIRCRGITRKMLNLVPGFDGFGPSNYTLSLPDQVNLSLGAAWKRAEGRECTQQEDLVYGMVALLDQGEKVVVEYGISWAELMRRCCKWGLVKSDVMTSDGICCEPGMCWAPDPSGNRVPRLADWQMAPVPMALATQGCEVSLAQVIVRVGPKTSNGLHTWGTLRTAEMDYSVLLRGLPPSAAIEYTGLVVGARYKRLLVILAHEQGTGRRVFHKVGMCEVIVNEDEDDIRDMIAEKAIVGHGGTNDGKAGN